MKRWVGVGDGGGNGRTQAQLGVGVVARARGMSAGAEGVGAHSHATPSRAARGRAPRAAPCVVALVFWGHDPHAYAYSQQQQQHHPHVCAQQVYAVPVLLARATARVLPGAAAALLARCLVLRRRR
ncbi:hypothetical protein HYPSUDRAFT_219222 [Hypholoma sublateritium FD-334 SS-4]|uniref:Uncharacterized protein n=1 Tax=Hypholoma sublateritium (strain FD-334 SS-4) TaxID=945553 RepID=A0A0D2NJR2_HYPSF|nr:hypothetical protein HYPSUDRAFT_219222 [Hypholoma sublateritium FD-334 SS-4]